MKIHMGNYWAKYNVYEDSYKLSEKFKNYDIKDIVFFLYSNVYFITEISNNFIVLYKKLNFIVKKN